jgi:hypothetical protein
LSYSATAFDHYFRTVADLLRPTTACDIQPGAGKHGQILRESANANGYACRVTATERESSRIASFQLNTIYDEIIFGDAVNLIRNPKLRFDFVVMGDCIQYLRKSDGLDLLNFFIYRTGYICVICPEVNIPDDSDGHQGEGCISTWSGHDFSGWDTLHQCWGGMNLFLIKGYQRARMRITG